MSIYRAKQGFLFSNLSTPALTINEFTMSYFSIMEPYNEERNYNLMYLNSNMSVVNHGSLTLF